MYIFIWCTYVFGSVLILTENCFPLIHFSKNGADHTNSMCFALTKTDNRWMHACLKNCIYCFLFQFRCLSHTLSLSLWPVVFHLPFFSGPYNLINKIHCEQMDEHFANCIHNCCCCSVSVLRNVRCFELLKYFWSFIFLLLLWIIFYLFCEHFLCLCVRVYVFFFVLFIRNGFSVAQKIS